jgi:hypothetical protein
MTTKREKQELKGDHKWSKDEQEREKAVHGW